MATVSVTIGPVAAGSAAAWLQNAAHVIDQLERGREKLPFKLPAETVAELRSFIAEACETARTDPFVLSSEYETARLRHLISYWFNITQLDDVQRERLGICWTPPAGRAFADALAAGVGCAMATSGELADFATRLSGAWAECQPAFAKGVAG